MRGGVSVGFAGVQAGMDCSECVHMAEDSVTVQSCCYSN